MECRPFDQAVDADPEYANDSNGNGQGNRADKFVSHCMDLPPRQLLTGWPDNRQPPATGASHGCGPSRGRDPVACLNRGAFVRNRAFNPFQACAAERNSPGLPARPSRHHARRILGYDQDGHQGSRNHVAGRDSTRPGMIPPFRNSRNSHHLNLLSAAYSRFCEDFKTLSITGPYAPTL